jgi:hypothetical protein
MGDHPCPNHDRPVVYKPEEMKGPDEKEDGAGNDQVQFLAHLITPICRLAINIYHAFF